MTNENEKELTEIKKEKTEALMEAFNKLGYNNESELGKEGISRFLNKRTKEGEFDIGLKNILLIKIGIDDYSNISVDNFIKGFIEFDEDVQRNVSGFIKAKETEENNIIKYKELINHYQNESLDSDGLSEHAKILIRITDVNIEERLIGIRNIIIKVSYDNIEKEINFKIGGEVTHLNETLEFKHITKRGNFKFIMLGINETDKIFAIGCKKFSLEGLDSMEKYTVKIIIPERDDERETAAYICAEISFYCSNYEFYQSELVRSEKKIEKLKKAIEDSKNYVNKVNEIYGKLGSGCLIF